MVTAPLGAEHEVLGVTVPLIFTAIVVLVMVADAVAEQPKKSVTVTVYTPGVRLLIVGVLPPPVH